MYHYFSPKTYCNAPKAKCFNVVVKLQVSKPTRETTFNSSKKPQKENPKWGIVIVIVIV